MCREPSSVPASVLPLLTFPATLLQLCAAAFSTVFARNVGPVNASRIKLMAIKLEKDLGFFFFLREELGS